ncbi:MAG: 3-isopropylmalate dehydrogenase [Patescibacteria group bacterium]
MQRTIAVLPGDGIGREVIPQAVAVLQAVAARRGHVFEFKNGLIGEDAYDRYGHPLPEETLDLCLRADAVLLGAVGSPRQDRLPPDLRPERAALLPLRKKLGLFANLRPVKAYPSLGHATTLKAEAVAGVDLLVVRELTGGLYFGPKERTALAGGGERAVDTLVYTTAEIERIARFAFKAALGRRRRLTSVDKANVLESSRVWRETVERLAVEYPGVELDHMYVDNCAMQLIRNPARFDVIVTENMFGDILTDEASMIAGSLGMLPSASLGGAVALYEPAGGSAPDIAGRGVANPLAAILSATMMLRYSFALEEEADAVERAVEAVLADGLRTADLAEPGTRAVGTEEMAGAVIARLQVL